MIVFPIILILLGLLALVTGVTGLAFHFSLPAPARQRLTQLEKDQGIIRADMEAHRRCLLTATTDHAKRYHPEKIAILQGKLDEMDGGIAAIEATRWGRKPGPAPAPELNPKWDTSKCQHAVITPVTPSGEEQIVAWICCNADCYEQLELTDPAVVDHLKVEAQMAQAKEIEANWDKVKAWTETDIDRARKFLEYIGDDKQAERYQAHLKGEQTEEQAKRFAARTQENEDMARKGRFSKGGYVPEQVFVPLSPDLNGLARDLSRKARDKQRQDHREMKWEKQREVDQKKGGNW